MNEMNEIGPRLRELREASDYTVERLAAELKVDPDVYRGYEQDGKDIPISLIYEVANKFGVDFAEILTGTPARLDTFQSMMRPFSILRVVRTGVIAVQQGRGKV